MAARLNLIVLRSLDPSRTVDFYRLLGIDFQQEQHGTGPIHWASEIDHLVLEIYPAKSPADVDATTRLGFEVSDVAALLETGMTILQEAKESKWGLRAIVQDPDGRAVELVELVEMPRSAGGER